MRAFFTPLLLASLCAAMVSAADQDHEDRLRLSLGDAITRALERNARILVAAQDVQHAMGTRQLTRAELLPDIWAQVTESRQTINLAAFGFPLPSGVPALVGPFNVFDARLSLSQTVFDLHALNQAKAEGHHLAAAELSYRSVRDAVVLSTANLYLQSLATANRAEAVQAQLRTAEALHGQAIDLKEAGLVAGIDVLRAELQLNTERQRATVSQNDAEKTKLQLARAIGLPAGRLFDLSDELPDAPDPDLTLDAALERALLARPDYLAALERVQAAEDERAAIVGRRLPSAHVEANVGAIGLSTSDAQRTYAVTGAVSMPIFQGGRTAGLLAETEATLRQRRAEANEVRDSIDYELRSAFLDLRATGQQLEVAADARTLADMQLTQARDRFAAGVSDNIEVVQAQEGVALSNDRYIAALYGHNVAKARLAQGIGVAEAALRQFLRGDR